MAIKTTAPSTRTAGLTKSLNQVLADSYALLSLTHLAHWNVEGPGFFALHTAFQTQYEELFVAIDEIAERIRALDAYTIGGLSTLAQAAQMKEFASPLAQESTSWPSLPPTKSWWPTPPALVISRGRRTTRKART